MLKIVCVGNQWRGADDGALFRALSRAGHIISIIDHTDFLPTNLSSFATKAINKLTKFFFIQEFNGYLLRQVAVFNPDLVIVYKGSFVYKETLERLKRSAIPVVNVFPDVSMFAHGAFIPECMPLYNHIFTTKSFGIGDLYDAFKIVDATYMPHAFDPEIHRELSVSKDEFPKLAADVSFIGTFSPKKEQVLAGIMRDEPALNLKVWGEQWQLAKEPTLQKTIQYTGITGDLYALGVNLSKINLAILSEQRIGSSSGDQITARTFQIPGIGGFMIHEYTEELLQYFQEDKELVTYKEVGELGDKIRYYLKNESIRLAIAKKGQEKVVKHHKVDNRAAFILNTLYDRRIINKI